MQACDHEEADTRLVIHIIVDAVHAMVTVHC